MSLIPTIKAVLFVPIHPKGRIIIAIVVVIGAAMALSKESPACSFFQVSKTL